MPAVFASRPFYAAEYRSLLAQGPSGASQGRRARHSGQDDLYDGPAKDEKHRVSDCLIH